MFRSITSESCLQGQGRRDLMTELCHIHRCTRVTYHVGCYVSLLLVNVLPLQDCTSHIIWVSQSETHIWQKEEEKIARKMFWFSLGNAFSG